MSSAQPGSSGPSRAFPVLGFLGGALSFVRIMRELDLSDIRREFLAPVRILVTGSDLPRAQWVADTLFGPLSAGSWSVAIAPLAQPALADDQPDLVVLTAETTESVAELLKRVHSAARSDLAVLAIAFDTDWVPPASENPEAPPHLATLSVRSDDADALTRLAPTLLLDLRPDLALTLGRRFPVFRAPVSERLIRETSRANAQFALLSSLPANLPLIGGAAGGLADLALLTKNQGILVYKLAGLYGRDLTDRLSLAIEITPVIGGAFFWRSLARTLLGLLPTVVGGIPKATVAYAGTSVVGEMARYYYRTGRRPPPALIARFQSEAIRLANALATRLRQL